MKHHFCYIKDNEIIEEDEAYDEEFPENFKKVHSACFPAFLMIYYDSPHEFIIGNAFLSEKHKQLIKAKYLGTNYLGAEIVIVN